MAFTYKWEITGVKCTDVTNHEGTVLRNSVCQTYWKLTGTDENGDEGFFSGATPFCAKNCCEEDFCEFESLAEADVLGWVQNIVNNDQSYKEHIDAQIRKMIENEKIVEPAMPWAPVPDEAPQTDPE